MMEARRPDAAGATCVSCSKPAVVILAVVWRNWTNTIPLCKRCQRQAVKCLSPEMPSKQDLQAVWNMAVEMAGETSYGVHDPDTGEYLGKSRTLLKLLERVRKYFGLKGDVLE